MIGLNARSKMFIAVAVFSFISFLVIKDAHDSLAHMEREVDKTWDVLKFQFDRRCDVVSEMIGIIEGQDTVQKNLQKDANFILSKIVQGNTRDEQMRIHCELGAVLCDFLEETGKSPKLTRKQTYIRLTAELAGLERMLFVTYEKYNKTAKIFNNIINDFPVNFVAPLLGFVPATTYNASPACLITNRDQSP